MSTVGQLIDRVLRDWLEPADDQPARLTLAQAIDSDDLLAISYDADLIGPEEIALIGPGTLIEIGSEEMIVADIDEDANTFDLAKRGANGTTPAAHSSGAIIYPHRAWRRRVIFDALCDGVVQLYPDLYRVKESAAMTVSSDTYTEVDAADATYAVSPMWFYGRCTGENRYRRIPLGDDDWLDFFPASATGKAFYVPGLPTGGNGYLVYKAKFERPDAEADSLVADFGVNAEWEQLVVLGAVAYLVAGREMDLATQERLAEQLEQQNYPAGTPSKIRDSILRYRQHLMDRAKDDLRTRVGVTVTMLSA